MNNKFTPFILIVVSLLGNVVVPLDGYSQELKRRPKSASAEGKKVAAGRPRAELAPATPYSYFKKAEFCSPDGAKKMMDELERENKSTFDQAELIRANIEEVSSRTAIIQEVTALRNQYESAMSELILDKDKKLLKPEIKQDLTSFKKMFRSGLTLNALSLMLKDADLSKDEHLKMSHLCQSNATQAVCSNSDGPNKMFAKKWILFGEDTHALDSVLENFKTAFKRTGSAEDKAKLKSDVEKIISSIPSNISPDKLLTVIKEKSPELFATLEKQIPGETIMKCLDEKSEDSAESLMACNDIISDPKKRSSFQSIITTQTQAMKKLLGDKFSGEIESVQQKRNEDMMKTFTSFDSLTVKQNTGFKGFASSAMASIEGLIKKSRKLILEKGSAQATEDKIKKLMAADSGLKREDAIGLIEQDLSSSDKQLDDLSMMFHVQPESSSDTAENDRRIKNAIAEARKKSREFKEICDFSKEHKPSTGVKLEDDERVRKCQVIMQEVKPKVDAMISLHTNSLKDLENKLKELKSGPFVDIELLKKFTAEKYICECTKSEDKLSFVSSNVELDQTVSTCQDVRFKASFNIQKIVTTAKNVNDVLSKSFGLDIETDINKCENTFSKANMAEFDKVCSKKGIQDKFENVCKTIQAETKVASTRRSEADYEKLYRENHVDFDPKLNRYVSTKKRSTGSILANGMIPTAAATLLPAWINDYQMRTSIDQLTNQGLFIKQYQHTMGMYNANPWMYGYNYFSNPFLNFNTSRTLPTSSGSTTNPGVGFSF